MRRLPRGSHLKCLTVFVTHVSLRSIPASASARSSSLPAGPTNGWPARSSSFPGCSPTSIMRACALPSPKTVWVPRSQRGHALQRAAAARTSASVPWMGTSGAAVSNICFVPGILSFLCRRNLPMAAPGVREYGNLRVLTTQTKSRPGTLVRQLGFFSATALVVSNMIGTGIFTTSGFMVGDLGDPRLVLLVWLVGALFAICGALSYSELGVNFPSSGGEYVYLTRAFGPAWGFMSGWISFFAGFSAPIAAAALAFSDYAGYFNPLFKQDTPAWTTWGS